MYGKMSSTELSGCAKCIRLLFIICNIPILVSDFARIVMAELTSFISRNFQARPLNVNVVYSFSDWHLSPWGYG